MGTANDTSRESHGRDGSKAQSQQSRVLQGSDDAVSPGNTEIELVPWTLAAPEPPVETPRSRLRTTAIMIALNLCMFVCALDQTIVATAIPTITADLKSASGYVWIGGAYTLANAAASPLWAKLSDIWGRKSLLLIANVWFGASSVICARAVSMKMLIIGRSLQGTACAGLIQLLMITISDLFSVRNRSLYYGLLEVCWAIAGGSGPILGGVFTEKLSWRWAFYINIPVVFCTFLLLLIFLDVHNPRTGVLEGLKAIDWFGSLSILGLTLMLLLGLEFGGATFAWQSPQVICLVVFGTLMSGVFIFSEKRLARYPLMPLELFKERSNIAALLLTTFHGMSFFALEYYLPLYFQSALEASPLRSGVLVLAFTVSEAFGGIAAGIFIHRSGRYLELLYVGTAFLTLGTGLCILFSADTPVSEIVGFQIISGLGGGLLFQAPLIAIQAACTPEATATATSTLGFARNLATAITVVICGVIFQNSMDLQVAQLSNPPVSLPANITQALSGGAAAANVLIISSITDMGEKLAVKEAFVLSIRNMWIFTTAVSGLTFVSALFVKRTVLSKVHVETKTGLKKESETAALVAPAI